MTAAAANVDEWKAQNAHRLIDCRWGCKITSEACRAYQTRTNRYVIHFQGHRDQYPRANADYVRCFMPEPCPNLLSDEEAASFEFAACKADTSHVHRRSSGHRAREMNRLVSPSRMLQEGQWHRSLVKL
jgi:hypothetical protein